MAPFFNGCRLSVAPLRYGAGVKGKVNQSLAYGLPVVVTTPAAEGMYLVDGESALIADEPAEFAAAIVRLYRDPVLWANSPPLVSRSWMPISASTRPGGPLRRWSVAEAGQVAVSEFRGPNLRPGRQRLGSASLSSTSTPGS